NRVRVLMTQIGIRHFLAVLFIVLAAEPAWAACGTGGQLARLGASPAKCTEGQLGTLDTVLSNQLQFRAFLDLPLATTVLRERKCPRAAEFEAFFAAWKQLPRTGVRYTAKKYCLTPPTVYGIRFPFPAPRQAARRHRSRRAQRRHRHTGERSDPGTLGQAGRCGRTDAMSTRPAAVATASVRMVSASASGRGLRRGHARAGTHPRPQ